MAEFECPEPECDYTHGSKLGLAAHSQIHTGKDQIQRLGCACGHPDHPAAKHGRAWCSYKAAIGELSEVAELREARDILRDRAEQAEARLAEIRDALASHMKEPT